jgi:hypothetical protein
MYTDNALLFPQHVIPTLRDVGSPAWQALVKEVVGYDEEHERTLAFMLMMIRISGCMACETDSYRAMRGCTACAHQTLRRYKGTDEDLINRYREALDDVRAFADEHPALDIQQE